jgi:hypothetical protein
MEILRTEGGACARPHFLEHVPFRFAREVARI